MPEVIIALALLSLGIAAAFAVVLQRRLRAAQRLQRRNEAAVAEAQLIAQMRAQISAGQTIAENVVAGGTSTVRAVHKGIASIPFGILESIPVTRDTTRVVRLISFAVHWVKSEIHEYVLKNWRIVKIATTKAQRKLFFNLRSSKTRLGWMNQAEVERIAAELNVKPEEVLQMESRLGGQDVSFSATPADGEDSYVPEDYLTAQNDSFAAIEEAEWQEEREEKMRTGLAALNDRERDILNRRWLSEGEKAGLQELADEYGVSAERIRQIEAAAMKKLRKQIEA